MSIVRGVSWAELGNDTARLSLDMERMMLKHLIARYPLAFGTAALAVVAVMWVWIFVLCLAQIAGRKA
jgi:hypothetical protein